MREPSYRHTYQRKTHDTQRTQAQTAHGRTARAYTHNDVCESRARPPSPVRHGGIRIVATAVRGSLEVRVAIFSRACFLPESPVVFSPKFFPRRALNHRSLLRIALRHVVSPSPSFIHSFSLAFPCELEPEEGGAHLLRAFGTVGKRARTSLVRAEKRPDLPRFDDTTKCLEFRVPSHESLCDKTSSRRGAYMYIHIYRRPVGHCLRARELADRDDRHRADGRTGRSRLARCRRGAAGNSATTLS